MAGSSSYNTIRIIYLHLSAVLGFILQDVSKWLQDNIGCPRPASFSQLALTGKEYFSVTLVRAQGRLCMAGPRSPASPDPLTVPWG